MDSFWNKGLGRSRIGFLGCGAMGKAMVRALLLSNPGTSPSKAKFSGEIKVYDPALLNGQGKGISAKAQAFVAEIGKSELSSERLTILEDDAIYQLLSCEVLILAVKPQNAERALARLANESIDSTNSLSSKKPNLKMVISILAGIPVQEIAVLLKKTIGKRISAAYWDYLKTEFSQQNKKLPAGYKDCLPFQVARLMPNLPLTIAVGAGAYCLLEGESKHGINSVADSDFFSCLPDVVWNSDKAFCFLKGFTATMGDFVKVFDSQMHTVTALSGSGPAYVAAFIEALTASGVRHGISRDLSYQLVLQTVVGTAQLLKQSNEHPAVFCDQVTSPGGTTASGVAELHKHKFHAAVQAGVEGAWKRSHEMSQGFFKE